MKTIRVTRAIHCSIEIAVPPAKVWEAVLDDVARAQYYVRAGYSVDPLPDAAPHLAGYRVRLETLDMVDDILGLMTEQDEQAMRLSVFGEYHSPQAKGLVAYATYQAEPRDGGTHYRIDGHATFDLPYDENAPPEVLAQSIAAERIAVEQGTEADFAELKARLEAAAADCGLPC
jgi:uncharacterized protein YndB with AHSA1/START domain